MLKIFDNKIPDGDSEKLLFYINQIVNVSIKSIEAGNEEKVIQNVEYLQSALEQLKQLNEQDPGKFNQVFFSDRFLDKYRSVLIEEGEDEESIRNAQFELALMPEEGLETLDKFLDAFSRIWEKAYRLKREDITTETVYRLLWILKDLSVESSNDLFIRIILRRFRDITHTAFHIRPGSYDASITQVVYRWFTSSVFRDIQNDNFDLNYLPLFRKHLWALMKRVVDEGRQSLFEEFVAHIHDGIEMKSRVKSIARPISVLRKHDPEYYDQNSGEIRERSARLRKNMEDLYSLEEVKGWKEDFRGYLEDLKQSDLFTDAEFDLEEYVDEVISFVDSSYKKKFMQTFLLMLGAWCLYKNNISYIIYLLDYQQPSDSDAIWAGHDFIPRSVQSTLGILFHGQLDNKKSWRWEGHHGGSKYIDRIIIYLLMVNIKNAYEKEASGDEFGKSSLSEFTDNIVDDLHLPDLNATRLNSIQHRIDDLQSTAEEMVDDSSKSFEEFGFRKDQSSLFLEDSMVPIFRKVKSRAKDKLNALSRTKEISSEKVDLFEGQVLETFYGKANMRNLLLHYGKVHRKLETIPPDDERFGIRQVADKAPFFDEWYVDYSNYGRSHGRSMARGEDEKIISGILENCDHAQGILEDHIGAYNNSSPIILSEGHFYLDYFEAHGLNFHHESTNQVKSDLEIPCFVGEVIVDTYTIPVFQFLSSEHDDILVLTGADLLPSVIQYSPLDSDEEEELLNDIFRFDIEVFSDNDELVDQFIQSPPKWLLDHSEKESEQRSYLEKRVIVNIHERFELEYHAFDGVMVS